MRILLPALTAFAVLTAAAPAMSAPCRDAKGKFTKCSVEKKTVSKRCRDAKGKFTKCSPEKETADGQTTMMKSST
ncbi:MAG: hypothetical protein ABF461_00730 [Zymomonas mobilis subsp. pomaceae]|uniref:Uncharacterized protein n=1 Tax=Zymomonas mobilis subsp. pomaceae (strain ATCC 29192 / DSM 22645 / JCM 10191 / CCUG 17912 / NBRC 13757 / NCIMB 11200 / NRRL B-4491 / Barker I) TaxID=579138 RepID=F8EVE4_ZYMMT|nr:hypothetical protein [Zymomonas mobilis]AEI37351.1 hypothetical protein Zymop_0448 [Zymomonas mobilis subsp. pomaceae ATCC 29192]MDX5948719.1 hypothetical protein [Zymomonas mobilis subsp. pomaceae]GEB88524.1 hypothetical protein ZMO02_01610 [Zymomonas mobilis subsp. pomaceae]